MFSLHWIVHQDDIGVKMDAELKKNIAVAVKPSELHKFSTKHPNACCSFVRSFVCLSEHFPLSDLHQIWNLTSLSGPDNCPVAANPAQVLQGVDPGGGGLAFPTKFWERFWLEIHYGKSYRDRTKFKWKVFMLTIKKSHAIRGLRLILMPQNGDLREKCSIFSHFQQSYLFF